MAVWNIKVNCILIILVKFPSIYKVGLKFMIKSNQLKIFKNYQHQ